MQAGKNAMTQTMQEWTKIFPKSMTETYSSSVTFMKQLTVVAISTIAYLKKFPDDSFNIEHFGGLKLRILKKKCRDEFAHFVSTNLIKAFEAFDKKYLHRLALCFYSDEFTADDLIEYYVFEYSYTEDGATMSVHSKGRDSQSSSQFSFENVREETLRLLRACMVHMRHTQHNPFEYCYVTIRLYYNDDAPEDYNVSGFDAIHPDDDHVGQLEQTVKVGSVQTPFHKLVARSYIRDSLGASHEAIPSQNAPMMTQNEDVDFDVEDEPMEGVLSVRCPCNKQHEDDHMLTCFYCNKRQHAACFGVRGGALAHAHCCERCARDPRRLPTDRQLAALPHKKRECLCIFRRVLQQLSQQSEMSAESLARSLGISDLNMAKLMRLLYSHEILVDGPDAAAPKKIVREKLNAVMSNYFQSPEYTIVDRLLAETVASQHIHDPVGDILEPLEKASLQNADTLGRVIDNVPLPLAKEDSTLQQYREAVLSNYQKDEDLPLSGSHNPVQDMENIGKKLGKRKMTDSPKPKGTRSAMLKTKRAKITA